MSTFAVELSGQYLQQAGLSGDHTTPQPAFMHHQRNRRYSKKEHRDMKKNAEKRPSHRSGDAAKRGSTLHKSERPLFPTERAREKRNSMIREKLRHGRELMRAKAEADKKK